MAFRSRNLFNHKSTHPFGGVGPDHVEGIANLPAMEQILNAIDLLPRNLPHNVMNHFSKVASVGAEEHATVHSQHHFFHGDFAELIQLIHTHANDASAHVTPSQPAQPPNQTGDIGAHDVSPPATQPPTQTQTGDTGAHDVSSPPATQPPTQAQTGDTAAHDVSPPVATQLPTQTQTGDTGTHDVSPPPATQPPTQTQTGDTGVHDVSPPAAAQPPATSQPVSLTQTATAIHSSYDGQVIENLDIYVDQGDAITITNDNVTLKNVRIHHDDGNGVVVSGANNVTIENVEIVHTGQQGTNENTMNIYVDGSPNLTVHNATLRDGSAGMYLYNSPGANISHVDGYNFHGPFPHSQFIQFNNSGNSTVTDFYAYNPAAASAPEDIISVYGSPNVTISNGVIDGNNSVSGVGIMFEAGSNGGRVDNVDAIHMGNGAFAVWEGVQNVIFNDTRSFDGIYGDQGRGAPLSSGVIWTVNGSGVSILNSTYTDPGNPNSIVWEGPGQQASAIDVHEDPNATPMQHIVNHYAWS